MTLDPASGKSDSGEPSPDGTTSWRLGDARVSPAVNEIEKGGEVRRLEPAAMDVLAYLIQQAPNVVPAAELLDALWPDVIVEESTIHRRISQLRQALGDNARKPSFIETVPKRGYRVVATVERIETERMGEATPQPEKDHHPEPEPPSPPAAPSQPELSTVAAPTLDSPTPSTPKPTAKPIARIALGLAAALLFLLGLWWAISDRDPARLRSPDAATLNAPIRIAVLPFQDFSEGAGDAYLAAGFHEDILSKLANVEGLRVTSRTSVERYRGADPLPPVPEIAKELGVTHVLEGSVRRSGDSLRISMQLIGAANDDHLWAETYDRRLDDLFAIQSEVARAVAAQLSIELTADFGQLLETFPTHDVDAYALVLQARELILAGTLKELQEAAQLYEMARQRAPLLAEAHAGLAEALFLQSFSGLEWHAVRERSMASIERALELDPESATAHRVFAHLSEVWEVDPETAERHYLQSLELEPNNSKTLYSYAAFLNVNQARPEEALPYAERAFLLDPLNPEAIYYLARTLVDLGRPDEARGLVERGLELDPQYLQLLGLESSIAILEGNLFASFEGWTAVLELDPAQSENLLGTAVSLANIGEEEAAQRWLERLESKTPNSLYLYLGNRYLAFSNRDADSLEAIADRWQMMNSNQRSTRFSEGIVSDFHAETRVLALSIRADDAHLAGRLEEEASLRRSAVEALGDSLRDRQGKITISIENVGAAIFHAINLKALGRTPESHEVLDAILGYNDAYDEFVTLHIAAHALRGDTAAALDLIATKANKSQNQLVLDEIRANRLGFFRPLIADPAFEAFYQTVAERNRVLRQRIRAELPGLIDASVGL